MIQLSLGAAPGTFRVNGDDARLGSALQPGRVVEATVERADGRLLARLGRLALPLPRGAPVAAGETIRLQVGESDGQKTLTLLPNRRPDATETALQGLNRRDLPRETGSLAALRPLPLLLGAGTGATAPPSLPTPVREALEALFQRLPTPERLTDAQGLRTALRDSGSLLESLLLRGIPADIAAIAGRDLKVALSRAAARLRAGSEAAPPTAAGNTPNTAIAELGRGMESLLARLNLLQAVPLSAEGRVDLAFELPLRAGADLDALELRILEEDADGKAPGEGGSGWAVDLRFRFGAGDSLEARLRLFGTESVAVTWTAEHPDTAARIEAALPLLTTALESAGLEVRHASARSGAVSSRHPALEEKDAAGLLHERA